MKKIALLFLLSLSACLDDSTALRTLRGAGYSDARVTGYRFMGCSKDDQFHTGFTAKGPTGEEVSGVVCSGFLKGATIRFD